MGDKLRPKEKALSSLSNPGRKEGRREGRKGGRQAGSLVMYCLTGVDFQGPATG